MPRTSATRWPRATSPTVAARLRSYRDAGVTDLAARVVPLGDDPAARARIPTAHAEFLASL